MKICRFNDDRIGVVQDGWVFDVTSAAKSAASVAGPSAGADTLVRALDSLLAMPPEEFQAGDSFPLASVQFLAPVRAPGKIVAAPVNYQAHIREMAAANLSPGHDIPEIGKAGLFLKATSSLVGPSQGIAIRFSDRRTDHEIELVAIVGRVASQVSQEKALEHVAGYCIGLDITLRGREDRSFRKSIDSYSVVGPWLTTADEVSDPQDLRLILRNNGEVRQDASTGDMLYGVARIISFASSFYTLHPGDIIFTGTPQGVSPINSGDNLEAECTRLGCMKVAVREA